MINKQKQMQCSCGHELKDHRVSNDKSHGAGGCNKCHRAPCYKVQDDIHAEQYTEQVVGYQVAHYLGVVELRCVLESGGQVINLRENWNHKELVAALRKAADFIEISVIERAYDRLGHDEEHNWTDMQDFIFEHGHLPKDGTLAA